MAHGFGAELPSWFDNTDISRMGEKAKALRLWGLTGQNGVCGPVNRRQRTTAPSPRCEGINLASTPSSPSFKDWYKCGSRTRDTRFIRPLLYPSELTRGGMKQSGRAVRACATRRGAQARQVGWRTHCRCTFDVSTSSRDSGNPQSQNLHPFPPITSHRPKRRDPGRQRLPGSRGEIVPGTAFWSAPLLKRTGLTHHDFQGARRRIAGIHWISRADSQRPALPRAKVF